MDAVFKANKSRTEKLRKPVSFAVAATLVVFMLVTKSSHFETLPYKLLELTGFSLVFIAAMGRTWCTLYIAGRKNQVLCTQGPYELCRNPLYLFSFIGLVGICLGAQSILMAVVASALYLYAYSGVIRDEEKRLQIIFGSDYDNYLKSTPRFWPRMIIPRGSHILQVDSRVFARSLREIIWFLFAVIALELIEIVKTSSMADFMLTVF